MGYMNSETGFPTVSCCMNQKMEQPLRLYGYTQQQTSGNDVVGVASSRIGHPHSSGLVAITR